MLKHVMELYLSQLLGRRIYDSAGKTVGKVQDVVVLWDGRMPRITGIRHTKDLHKLIPADFVSNWNVDGVRLAKPMGKTPVVDYWRWRFRRADR